MLGLDPFGVHDGDQRQHIILGGVLEELGRGIAAEGVVRGEYEGFCVFVLGVEVEVVLYGVEIVRVARSGHGV